MSLLSCGGCKGCSANQKIKTDGKLLNIALVGNPNVGKSVIFNVLTGYYVEVSNYPGTTVDTPTADTSFGKLIDTPGIYGIGNHNDEEIIAKNIVLNSDIIVNVVSALSLERDLFLTLQLIDMGFPLIVVLNQYDEAISNGIKINSEILEKHLGVKVITAIATKNQGICQIKDFLINNSQITSGIVSDYLKNFIADENLEKVKRIEIISELESDFDKKEVIYSSRRKKINKIIENILSTKENDFTISGYLGNLLLNPVAGVITAAFVLFALYQVVGVMVAGNIVDFLENKILLKYYFPFITNIINSIIPSGSINQILVGEFGLLTMTFQYILGLLLPLVFSFNLFMAILEDSGYLPRLAALTDRFLTKLGLNGRAIIPLILGFGCITMATITTRILGSQRERTIATAVLGLIIPCSAQLGLIIGLIAIAGGLKAWLIYLITIFTILTIVGTVLNKILPGESTHLFIDLPPMRLPLFKNVINKTLSKTKHFLIEATPLFLLGSLFISILQVSGSLIFIQKALAPLTVNLLHLPPETANVFIMGLIRRDFGAAGLAGMAGLNGGIAVLNHSQIIVSLVVITLFVPCIASVVIMFKERGWKEASLIWIGSWVSAFITGSFLSNVLRIFM